MITIILCGKQEDTSVSEALLPALSCYGGVTYVGTSRFSASIAEKPRFLLCDYTQLPEIRAEKGILFLKNSFSTQVLEPIPPGFLCVFESHNHNAAAHLKGTGAYGITCGMSGKDTLSFSSFDYSCATASLQRCITTVEGEILEPHEILIQMGKQRSPRQVLAVCMVLLLTGMDSSQGYSI